MFTGLNGLKSLLYLTSKLFEGFYFSMYGVPNLWAFTVKEL